MRTCHRPAWLEIDLGAVAHNIRSVKRAVGVQVMAIVKANAYGHGLVPVARAVVRCARSKCGTTKREVETRCVQRLTHALMNTPPVLLCCKTGSGKEDD